MGNKIRRCGNQGCLLGTKLILNAMDNNSQEIEEWRSIEGYEGLYQVSSLWRVRSLDRYESCYGGTRLRKGRVLRLGKNNGGYLHIVLCKYGKLTHFLVHRLVWEAFNGKIPEGMQVNHIDEDKSNNTIENLNLMTPKENINWGTCIERSSKKHSKPIIQMDLEANFIAEHESIMDAERKVGICYQSILACCRGKQKTAGGYIFRYKTA